MRRVFVELVMDALVMRGHVLGLGGLEGDIFRHRITLFFNTLINITFIIRLRLPK
jgi:hypothetical protein